MPNEDRSSSPRSCPDCGGEMEPGFLPGLGGAGPTHWHPGLPTYHDTFFGIKVGGYELKWDRSKLIPVVTWRCCDCHLLRSYAD